VNERCGVVSLNQPETLVVGKYQLVRRIASGGMGEVFEARHAKIGSRVAIKFLRADRTLDARHLARFEREACSAGALEHENIACTLDVVTTGPRPFIIMEYVDGETLARRIDRGPPLAPARAAALMIQAARALSAAHASGIIHRDLKPGNMMLTKHADGTDLLKVLDFGIARLVRDNRHDNLTTTGAVLGTPHYMSPEQARGEKLLDERVDIHALGAILYELLSGRRAYPGDSYNAIMYQLLTKPPTPLMELRPRIPKALADVVDKALAKDADRRYRSVNELGEALAPFSTPRTTTALDTGAVTGATNPILVSRKGSSLLRHLGPAFAACVAAALGFLAGSLRDPSPYDPEITAREAPQLSSVVSPPAVSSKATAPQTAIGGAVTATEQPTAAPAGSTKITPFARDEPRAATTQSPRRRSVPGATERASAPGMVQRSSQRSKRQAERSLSRPEGFAENPYL
jgi:eukaryotic-like serine/threonine-protein kinase